MRIVLVAVVIMYAIQGSINGLTDSTLPQLLNRNQAALHASEILAIVKLPAALKLFFAPFADYCSQTLVGGYKGLVISLQIVAAAIITNLIPLLNDDLLLGVGGDKAAIRLRWPLFAAASATAISDLALDAFASKQMPENLQHLPALCQVVGVFVGKTAAKSGLFFLMELKVLSLQTFAGILAASTLVTALAVGVVAAPAVRQAGPPLGMGDMLQRLWAFSTQRRNMPHWLLYQLLTPSMYFHAVSVLPSRYEQHGFQAEEYAAYDLPLAFLNVAVLILVSRAAEDPAQPLSFVMKAYFGEVLVIVALLTQYTMWSGSASAIFTLVYSVLSKVQDLMFFVFEMFEFAFYGRVASLDPQLVATLITLQASAFNFSEFFHCWLAPYLVDRLSSCSMTGDSFSCSFDAYPMVASLLTMITLVFIISQWNRIHAYQDIAGCPGWQPQAPLMHHKIMMVILLGSILLFTLKEVVQ